MDQEVEEGRRRRRSNVVSGRKGTSFVVKGEREGRKGSNTTN